MRVNELLPGLASAPNLHPMVVHFPIAFWLAGAGAWVWALFRDSAGSWRFGRWLHSLGLVGGVIAVAFGFAATSAMGHDGPGHDLVHVHRELMVWATVFSATLTALAWTKLGASANRLLAGLSLALIGLASLGADRGAELVYRYGVGVAQQPPPATEHTHDHGEPAPDHPPRPPHPDAPDTPVGSSDAN